MNANSDLVRLKQYRTLRSGDVGLKENLPLLFFHRRKLLLYRGRFYHVPERGRQVAKFPQLIKDKWQQKIRKGDPPNYDDRNRKVNIRYVRLDKYLVSPAKFPSGPEYLLDRSFAFPPPPLFFFFSFCWRSSILLFFSELSRMHRV